MEFASALIGFGESSYAVLCDLHVQAEMRLLGGTVDLLIKMQEEV